MTTKKLEGNESLYLAFVDLEKAYDRVPRELVSWALRRKGVPEKMVRMVRELYRGAKTAVRTGNGVSEYFAVEVGLHQGSALSPFIFITIMDEVAKAVQQPDLWEILYADDLAIVTDSSESLQERLRAWQEALESKGLRVNARKTEVMASCRDGRQKIEVKDTHDTLLKQVDAFKYLGSVIKATGGCEEEAKERVKKAWGKWREVRGVICDRHIPRRVKAKVYRTIVRPVLLYGSETWALRKREEDMIMRTEMRMLRWIMGVSRLERCTNEEIRKAAGVVSITEKLREARLRWVGHVVRREEESWIQKAKKEPVRGRRSRGRQRLRWSDVVKRDMEVKGVQEEDAWDRKRWRKKIHAADP